MTRRGAVEVGCRLIAIYFVVNTAFEIMHWMVVSGFTSIGSNMGGGQFGAMLQQAAVVAMLRAGVAVMLWVAAPRISRIAAAAEEGDEDWHGA